MVWSTSSPRPDAPLHPLPRLVSQYIYIYYSSICCKRGEHQEHPPNFWLRGELVLLFLTRPADQSVLSSAGLQTSPKHPNISQPITILERIGRTPKSQTCLLRAFCGNLARFGIAIDQGMLVDGIQRLQAFVIAKSSIQNVGKTLWTSAQQDLNIPQSQSWKVDFWIHFLSLLICDELQHCTTHLVQVRRKLLFFALDQHLTIPSGQFYRDIVLWRTPCPGWLLLW